jgi:hypothetical protein
LHRRAKRAADGAVAGGTRETDPLGGKAVEIGRLDLIISGVARNRPPMLIGL